MNGNNVDVSPGEILLSTDELARAVERLGAEITRDYKGRHPILVNLLKGGVVFLADLIRQVKIPHTIEFMTVSSYEEHESTGDVRIAEDLRCDIDGRHVLIIEDVVDTGTTLAYILNMLRLRGPESIEVCTLLKKRVATEPDVPIRYLGIEIPDVFVVGYGLDHNENFRHLPYIARLDIPDIP